MDHSAVTTPTYLGNMISAADNETLYDENAKLILADKSVLSWILKRCTNEFMNESLETIRTCIDGEPSVGSVHVEPHLTNAQSRHTDKLETLSQEDTSPSEGQTTFDVRFKVKVPDLSSRIEMIINVEAQKDYHPGYPLVSRGIFYSARMLSAQLHKDFDVPDYGQIKKVYSIWLCFRPPAYMKGKIVSYQIQPMMLCGKMPDQLAGYDLMRVVIIGLTDDIGMHKDVDETIQMLSTLFSTELNAEEKKRRLENDFHFKMSREIEERSALMCNLSALVLEKGIQQGRQEGIQQGRQEGIQQEKENSLYKIAKISREYGIPMEITLSKLKSDKEWEDSEVDRVVQIVYSS